jgi:hypothetical protein
MKLDGLSKGVHDLIWRKRIETAIARQPLLKLKGWFKRGSSISNIRNDAAY